MTFRWMHVAILIVALSMVTAAQDVPRQRQSGAGTPSSTALVPSPNGNNDPNIRPDGQDANHRSSALNRSNNLEKSQSAMQKSAPTAQNNRDADEKIAAQTSPQHDVRTSTWGLFWLGVIVIVLLILRAARRPRPRRRVVRPVVLARRDEDVRHVA